LELRLSLLPLLSSLPVVSPYLPENFIFHSVQSNQFFAASNYTTGGPLSPPVSDHYHLKWEMKFSRRCGETTGNEERRGRRESLSSKGENLIDTTCTNGYIFIRVSYEIDL